MLRRANEISEGNNVGSHFEPQLQHHTRQPTHDLPITQPSTIVSNRNNNGPKNPNNIAPSISPSSQGSYFHIRYLGRLPLDAFLKKHGQAKRHRSNSKPETTSLPLPYDKTLAKALALQKLLQEFCWRPKKFGSTFNRRRVRNFCHRTGCSSSTRLELFREPLLR